ncbi:Threonine/homoserine efflux transporter RhtA [Desulfonatronum thiosulfatophilum]|uniref:Threonine/homoserine efflux transporter RhtA n=1 Tax=Desulfonatronum thiosulfatophilum TaxID=617002 RepID=A0A1G6BQ62_9BACT|nr:DMT family transporter [Desulfonatronum thiosulfatophilum]SDB22717.1 Threonine/homoserine efflux transporter RhtA [Desulfonatronum thiosulfatophilum]
MRTYIKLLCTSMFWGGTFVAGRLVSRELPPFSAAFLRFAIASVCLVILVRIYEGGLPRPRAAQILPIIVLGLSGIFAYNVLFFIGLQTVEAGRAAVIVATNPIFVALLAALLFQEPLGPGRLVGIGLSVSGAVLAITGGHPLALFNQVLTWGDVAIFGCVASWVTYLLVGKVMMQNLSPHAAVTYSCLAGTVMLLPFSLTEGLIGHLRLIPWTLWAALLYLGMFGTVLGFTWFYQAVKEIGPSRAAVFINFVPIWAIVSGFLILGESLNLTLIMGAAMVGGGVYLTNRKMKTPGAEIRPRP